MENSTLKEQLKEIDDFIEEQKGYLEMAEAAGELENDPNFIKVVREGFLEAEAERIMGALVTPGSFDKGKLDILQEKMASIRHFKEYFKMLAIQAHLAPEHIEQHQKYRESLLKEAGQDFVESDVVGE